MATRAEFMAVFTGLRGILAEYAPKLNVVHDKPDNYYLDTYALGANKRPISFGGVRMGKAYVSYYLMPIYGSEVRDGMSPALKKRMQGRPASISPRSIPRCSKSWSGSPSAGISFGEDWAG